MVIQAIVEDAVKGRPAYLQNLVRASDIEKGINDATTIVNDTKNLVDAFKGLGKLQNLDTMEPELQNLLTLKQAGGIAKKAKSAGLFQNLDQDVEL